MDPKIEAYLDYLRAVRGLAERSVRSYAADLEGLEAYLREAGLADPDAAGPRELRGFAASLVAAGKAASSVNRALSAVRGYYRHRVRHGGLAADPSRDLEGLPAPRGLPAFMFEEETADFIELAGGTDFRALRDRAILETLYSTGCRVGELCGLTMESLDLESGTAKVLGKGSKERIVFLAPPARKALAEWLAMRAARLGPAAASTPWVFLNARNGRLGERGVQYIVRGYADKVAAEGGRARNVTPHAFRHSFATHVTARGADIRAVQELLGHASVSTTQIYAHVDVERLRRVYENAHPHGGPARGGGKKA